LKSRKRSPLREPNAIEPSDGNPSHGYSSIQSKVLYNEDKTSLVDKNDQKYRKADHDYVFRRDHHFKDTTHNIDSSDAIRDANVKFLNDFSVGSSNGQYEPSHLTKVSVTVPSVPTSSSYTTGLGSKEPSVRNGYGERDRNANLDQVTKSDPGRRKLKEVLRMSDPNDGKISLSPSLSLCVCVCDLFKLAAEGWRIYLSWFLLPGRIKLRLIFFNSQC